MDFNINVVRVECHKCRSMMNRHDALKFVCGNKHCVNYGKPVEVPGVYPFQKVDAMPGGPNDPGDPNDPKGILRFDRQKYLDLCEGKPLCTDEDAARLEAELFKHQERFEAVLKGSNLKVRSWRVRIDGVKQTKVRATSFKVTDAGVLLFYNATVNKHPCAAFSTGCWRSVQEVGSVKPSEEGRQVEGVTNHE